MFYPMSNKVPKSIMKRSKLVTVTLKVIEKEKNSLGGSFIVFTKRFVFVKMS